MLTDYIKAALKRAKYEIIEDDKSVYAEIPELPGVWANAATLEACREELAEVLEGWLILSLQRGHEIPVLDRINLNPRKRARRKSIFALIIFILMPFPCAGKNPNLNEFSFYFGFDYWYSQHIDLWNNGGAFRIMGLRNDEFGNLYGYYNLAMGGTKYAMNVLRTTDQVLVSKDVMFLEFGCGIPFLNWNEGKSYIGGGISLCYLTTGEEKKGYVLVQIDPDGTRHELGPAKKAVLFLAPELNWHFHILNINKNIGIGIETRYTFGKRDRPPNGGIFLGLTLFFYHVE